MAIRAAEMYPNSRGQHAWFRVEPWGNATVQLYKLGEFIGNVPESEWFRLCRQSCRDFPPSPEPRREDGWVKGPLPDDNRLCVCAFSDGSFRLMRTSLPIPDPPAPQAPEPPKAVRVRIKDSNCELFAIIGPNGSAATFRADGTYTGLYRKEDVEVLAAAEPGGKI
jgi:hypothetical protein